MTQHNQSPKPESDEWNACAPGEIQGVVNSLRQQRRRKQIAQATAVGTSLVLIFAVTLFSLPGLTGNTGMNTHAMACHEVVQHAEDYLAGQLSALTTGQVDTHLSKCSHCNEYIEDLRLRQNSTGQPASQLMKSGSSRFELSFNSLPSTSHSPLLLANR